MHPLREQREYAVLEAAHREREARAALEAVSRHEDTTGAEVIRLHRARWQAAARALGDALRALKN
jgi:hypothetical protein